MSSYSIGQAVAIFSEETIRFGKVNSIITLEAKHGLFITYEVEISRGEFYNISENNVSEIPQFYSWATADFKLKLEAMPGYKWALAEPTPENPVPVAPSVEALNINNPINLT